MSVQATARRGAGSARRAGPHPLLLVFGAILLARGLLAAWWLAVDERVPDIESARHLAFAWDLQAQMADGQWLAGFAERTIYPPLHHLIGALGVAVAGVDVEPSIAAQAAIVLPAYAIGVYGAASIAYGRLAGVLATVFALAAPMAVSMFHMFLIDAVQAALVAVTLWLVLASDRFSRTGIAALAGVAAGLGMLSKQNFPLFVAGFILVVLVRGGWRNWRGLLAFAGIAALLTLTWYWSELERTRGLVIGAGQNMPATEAAGSIAPSRWTTKNFGYYVWSTLNLQLLVPMTLAFVGGTCALLVRYVRDRTPRDVTPELVAGGLVSYLGLTYIWLKDPRYAFPAMAYMAILGTGWIVLLRPRLRTVAIGGLAVVAAVNVVGAVAAPGGRVAVSLPGAPPSVLGERRFTFYLPDGWIVGRPWRDGEIVEMMREAKADGVERVDFDPGAQEPNFNTAGLGILARVAGLPQIPQFDPEGFGPEDLFMTGRWPGQDAVKAKPCATLEADGRRIYIKTGQATIPFEQWPEYYCPLRPGSGPPRLKR